MIWLNKKFVYVSTLHGDKFIVIFRKISVCLRTQVRHMVLTFTTFLRDYLFRELMSVIVLRPTQTLWGLRTDICKLSWLSPSLSRLVTVVTFFLSMRCKNVDCNDKDFGRRRKGKRYNIILKSITVQSSY